MLTTKISDTVRYAQLTAQAQERACVNDADLIEAFLTQHHEAEAAFATLVQRHGRMVLGVCLRLLGERADAEDAFQATFLVLARKADSVRPRQLVGNWLYGVAYRTALQARANRTRRRSREMQLENTPEPIMPEHAPEQAWRELQPVLDEELNRLPDKYRTAIVLCELEGQSRKDVAVQLGIPEGTLSSRLATARKMLAARLARRGVVLPAGTLALVLAQSASVSAAMPAALVVSTVQAAVAVAVAANEAAAVGLVSAQVAALTNGVVKNMFYAKIKMAAAIAFAVAAVGTGVGFLAHHAFADQSSPIPAAPVASVAPVATGADVNDAPDEPNKKPAEGEKPAQRKDGERPANKPRDGEKPPAKGETVTVTGRVTKDEQTRKRDDGSEIKLAVYYLTEENSNRIQLPAQRGREGGDGNKNAKFNLDDFVDKEVTITGQLVREGRPEKRVARFTSISEIKEKKK